MQEETGGRGYIYILQSTKLTAIVGLVNCAACNIVNNIHGEGSTVLISERLGVTGEELLGVCNSKLTSPSQLLLAGELQGPAAEGEVCVCVWTWRG